jgi:uncharacterized RDD family membrane protein YckC
MAVAEPVSAEPVSTRHSITQELQGRRAGLVSRFAAAIIDLLVIVLVLGLIYAAVAGFAFLIDPRSFHWPEGLGWSIPLVGLVIALPYLTIAWCASGRTMGDVLLGLRVVTGTSARVRLPRSLLRAAFCLVFPLGLFWVPFSPSRRSLQDTVLRTSVIYDWASHRSLRR